MLLFTSMMGCPDLIANSKLRLAIVGCGAIAENSHLPAALSFPLVELAAVCDANELRLRYVQLSKKDSGGGVLVVSGSHLFDRMFYLFDDASVVSYADDSRGGVEANCVVAFECKDGCSRVVHLSGVRVYGNNPPPESVTEAAPVRGTDNSYGREKLWQEQRVRGFGKRHGLPFVILRPAEVYGAFSYFTQALISRIQAGRIAVLDGGDYPCSLVYVDNLVQAILLSLWKSAALGEIFFVTDPEVVSWGQCLADHAAWVGVTLPSAARHEVVSPKRERVVLDSLKLLPRVLLSREARSFLRRIPLVKLVETTLYKSFQSLSPDYKQKLRIALNGPLSYPRDGRGSAIFYSNDPIMALQGRRVAHSSEKAQRLLGYSAPVSYSEGMALTEAWLRSARILPVAAHA